MELKNEWSLLCPGPSLRRLEGDRFQPRGPVVAINSAVLCPLAVDYWCMQDSAATWETTAAEVRAYRRGGSLPVVWCPLRQVPSWQDLGFRTWCHHDDESGFRAAYVRTPAPISYTPLTITTALARMVAYGAQRVLVYGCDMAGTSYGYGTDKLKRHHHLWEQRWQAEQNVLKQATDQWSRICGTEFQFRSA